MNWLLWALACLGGLVAGYAFIRALDFFCLWQNADYKDDP